jgi:hypothetical protein
MNGGGKHTVFKTGLLFFLKNQSLEFVNLSGK